MKKNYIYIILLALVFGVSSHGYAQSIDDSSKQNIEGLMVHPNPATHGKLYITSSQSLVKTIEIYSVLGKKVLATMLMGKELDISDLNAGVYILKIVENDISATRKLVVK